VGDIFPPYSVIDENDEFVELSVRGYEFTVHSWKETYDDLPSIVVLKIEEAIDKMHNLSVLHGDLHGSNIVFDRSNDVRIIDFDESKFINDLKPDELEKYASFWDVKSWTERPIESVQDLLWYERNIIWNN
jgi:serine/threonine protein kinase